MKKVAVAGTWRTLNQQMEEDVKKEVKYIIESGNSIVTGGALGVDYIATEETLSVNSDASKIKIFLPATLEIYARHYLKRAEEGVITREQAQLLISQLTKIRNLNINSIVENLTNEVVDHTTYRERINDIINDSDELIAFQANESNGTQYTIDKANQKGIPVKVYKYSIN